jgi:hypothetical protein
MLLSAILSALCTTVSSAGAELPRTPVTTRIVRVGGPLDSLAVRRHLEFSLDIGFNAVWVSSSQAGRWGTQDKRRRPELNSEFRELAHWCRVRGVRLFVAVRPVAEFGRAFAFSRPGSEAPILEYLHLLRRQAGVEDFVLSFRDAPMSLSELGDVVEYGASAAPAHVALAARLRSTMPEAWRLWFVPARSSDLFLADLQIPYAAALLEPLRRLDERVGAVWTRPLPVSPAIHADDLAASRVRWGSRPVILEDRYPGNLAAQRSTLALLLGPLRHRDANLAPSLAGYLACPMRELAGSRLALLTIADYLRVPAAYVPELSWRTAIARLAGENARALQALRTQAMEWGGWIGGRNYHPPSIDNPQSAALSLRDPALVATWTWIARRYPERMEALGASADSVFRSALLEIMARRLAVARAVPLVVELRERQASGGDAAKSVVQRIEGERERVRDQPGVLLALERFLSAAGADQATHSRSGK